VGGDCRIIFDVGANRGDITALYRQGFPEAEIFAFEPFPESLDTFKGRHGTDNKIHAFQLALAAEEGEKILYVNHNVDTNSLLQPRAAGLSSDKQVKNVSELAVKTATLDVFCRDKGIEYIDILKMDIQGGEWAALQGASGLLQKGMIGLIYSEVFFIEQYKDQPLFHDISKLLHSYGYNLQDIYSPFYGKGNIAWGDAIFTKR